MASCTTARCRARFPGLSVKLIATIIVVILAVEVVIYLPSVANFRAELARGPPARRHRRRPRPRRGARRHEPAAQPHRPAAHFGRRYAIVYRRDGQSQLIELENNPDAATWR